VPAGSVAWQLGWVAISVLATRSAPRPGAVAVRDAASDRTGRPARHTHGLGDGRRAWRRCAVLCGPLMAAMVVGHDPVQMVTRVACSAVGSCAPARMA
jgi:hypothetical protein